MIAEKSPIVFPSEQYFDFHEACQAAQAEERELLLVQGTIITLLETIRINKKVTIRGLGQVNDSEPEYAASEGGCDSGDIIAAADTRPLIVSSAHSIITCSKKSHLDLSGVRLRHTLDVHDHRLIGACVFVRNTAKCYLQKVQLVSVAGFCVWGIQEARVELQHCHLSAARRSGCVLFGSATLTARHCRLVACGVHGVCLRGSCCLALTHCLVGDCRRRGVYAYGDTRVALEHCVVRGTREPLLGAVEFRLSGPHLPTAATAASAASAAATATGGGDSAPSMPRQRPVVVAGSAGGVRLVLRSCSVLDNAGYGVRLVCVATAAAATAAAAAGGGVQLGSLDPWAELADCVFRGNVAGDTALITLDADAAAAAASTEAEEEDGERAPPASVSVSVSALTSTSSSACSHLPPAVWQFERDDPAEPEPGPGAGSDGSCWRSFDASATAVLEGAWVDWLAATSAGAGAGVQTEAAADTETETEAGEDKEERGLGHCTVAGGLYRVDLARMTQTNALSLYERRVRRV